jgi:hypothetical protein
MSEYLCKDCKHSFRSVTDIFLLGFNSSLAYKCKLMYKESAPEPNPVTGVKIKPAHYESCSIARMDYLSASRKDSNCGPDAKWWQPKDKKQLFRLIAKHD